MLSKRKPEICLCILSVLKVRKVPLRTLHRDLLLPCGFLSEKDKERVKPEKASKPKTRTTPISSEEILLILMMTMTIVRVIILQQLRQP